MAALAAAGVTTPEGVLALAQRPDVSAYATLQASVTALGGELQAKTTEIQALAARLNAADEEKRGIEAGLLVDRYERAGKITPATRENFRTLALADRDAFVALADKLPVIVGLRAAGTASGGDADEPETLHALAMRREADSKASGTPLNYAQAVDQVATERPDLVDAWRQAVPLRVAYRAQ